MVIFPKMIHRRPTGTYKYAPHNCQGNANQNHNEISPYICQNVNYQNEVTSVGKDVEESDPLRTFGGNKNWCSPI